jgi:ribonucleotide monophosphatase NagD (HAD superfamily)
VGISALSYPAVIQSAGDYNASVNTGVTELANRLNALHKRCPGEKVFLVGHSQGAHVIHRLLLRRDFANAEWVRQASLFADPARPVNVKSNSAGTYNALALTASQPLEANIPRSIRGKVKNVCSNYDIICNNPLEASLAFVMAGISTACDTHNGGYFGKPRSGCWSRPPLSSPAVREILAAAGLSEESFNQEMSVNRVTAEGQRLAKLAARA